MKAIFQLLSLVTCIGLSVHLTAQEDQAIGQWKSYLPYNTGKYVTQGPSEVYYATELSLLIIDKEENSIRRLSKVEGLSDVGMGIIGYSPFSEVLLVTYSNGNIDLVQPDRIINLPFVKNENIVGDRNIYNIFFASGRRAFLSTGFGILEIDPLNATFTNDIRTGVAVLDMTAWNGYLWAATNEGIYRASDRTDINLQDFSTNWSLVGPSEGFPADFSCNALTVFGDRLFLSIDGDLYSYDGSQLELAYQQNGYFVKYLQAGPEHLFAGLGCTGGCKEEVVASDGLSTFVTLPGNCANVTTSIAEETNGRIWLGDEFREVRRLDGIGDSECERVTYEGPFTANIWDLDARDGRLWVATGGLTDQYTYLFRSEGFLSYSMGQWEVYNRDTRTELRGEDPDPDQRADDLFDFVTIQTSPAENKVYAGSFIEGLIEYDLDTDQMTLYNEKNSTIGEVAENDPGRTRISGLAFDSQGNLWLTNFLAENPFSLFTRQGEWYGFSTGDCGNYTRLLDVVVDRSGNKWMVVEDNAAGLLVFNEGDSAGDPTDDQCRIISESNSLLPTNRVNCIAVDLEGDVWVGTEDGAIVFECGSQVFDPEICQGNLRIVEVGGDNEYLLKGENVQTIAIDGANRKWFGTTNGIFVQNPAGDEQVLSFSVTDSPLLDNQIIDLAIDQERGEVFIGTAKGLQSYRTEAVAGGVINSANITVFPNPVRPEYEGPIAIRGLARDANVKITDITGQLVYETTALGGQAIWDGKDYNGRKASSGVYLVFSTSTQTLNNPDAAVAKILFLN